MTGGRGWWRRNWWALLGLLPVLVAMVLVNPYDAYQMWWTATPRVQVSPGADGWAEYAGTRVRLAEFTEPDLRDSITGDPVTLPRLRAWQATVTIGRIADPDNDLLLCEFELEDEQGRRYGDGPRELSGMRLGPDGPGFFLTTTCRPDEEQAGAESFDVVARFVLPDSTRPAALRMTAADALPRYVRFPLEPAGPGAG